MPGWNMKVNVIWCQLSVLCLIGGLSSGNFSLFLRKHEVHRLLGLNSELYYVRDGKVNHYALGFEVVVPNEISELHFTWQSLSRLQVHYSIKVLVNKTEALGTPHLDIPKQGLLPEEQRGFQVSLPCTGEKSEEVDVRIQINVTTEGNPNITFLTLKRRKVCLKDLSQNGTMLMGSSPVIASTSSFYISVGCATVLIVVMTAVATACYIRSQNARRSHTANYRRDSPRNVSFQSQTFLRVDTPNNANTVERFSSFRRLPPLSINPSVQVNNLRASELTEKISEMLKGRE